MQFVKSAASPAESTTDNSGSMVLGYCNDGNSGSISAQCYGPHNFGGAVLLPASILNKYVGDTIDSIAFAISPKRGMLAQVFVSSDLGSNKLSTGSTTKYQQGWNTVKLKNAITILEDRPLYVGYEVVIDETEYVDCVQFDTSPYCEPDCNFYGLDGSWYSATVVPYNVSVRAYISGQTVPDNDVYISHMAALDGTYVEQNSEVGYSVDVRNYGKQPVKSITFTVESNGQTVDQLTVDDLDIQHNKLATVDIEGVRISTEGNTTLTLKADKVNAETDPDDSDNDVSAYTYTYKEGTQPDTRTVLFEHFTSEAYEDSPAADSLYAERLAGRTDVVWAKHHMDYAGNTDQFTLDAESPYFDLFSDGKKFVPALAIDRRTFSDMEEPGPAYFVANGQMVDGLIEAVKEVPTFMHLDVTATANEAQGTIDAKVGIHAGTKEMPRQSDLRLTVWLVEDSILSTQQAGRDEYVQNGVTRALLSESAWGDAIDISGYELEKTYNVAIQDGWNVKNMRVVAFVSNYAMSVLNRGVYNAAQGAVTAPTGIDAMELAAQPAVRVVDGRIQLSQGATLRGVYDMAGRQVSNSKLARGVYLVRTACGQQTQTTKILIK